MAAKWKDFAIALYLDKGNPLEALFEECFCKPIRMAGKLCDLYLNNERDREPRTLPSWRELLDALRRIKEHELVRKLDEYLYSKALSRVQVQQLTTADSASENSLPNYFS